MIDRRRKCTLYFKIFGRMQIKQRNKIEKKNILKYNISEYESNIGCCYQDRNGSIFHPRLQHGQSYIVPYIFIYIL